MAQSPITGKQPEKKVVLRTQGLAKVFGALIAVNSVDFELHSGELHAIIGPNGAGKTTFFNLISGKLKPTRGRVFLTGHNITGRPPYEIARQGLARSFQISNLMWGLTVFENVRLAVQARRGGSACMLASPRKFGPVIQDAYQVLERVGLTEVCRSKVTELSHGMQRQLEIALTLALEPKVILLDEPTAGMARDETETLARLIKELSREVPILLIEHDMDVVFTVADKISVLYYGQMLFSGLPEEVSGNKQVIEAYLGKSREVRECST